MSDQNDYATPNAMHAAHNGMYAAHVRHKLRMRNFHNHKYTKRDLPKRFQTLKDTLPVHYILKGND